MTRPETETAEFLDHFQRELDFLLHEGEAFAGEHPLIAGRLRLGDQQAPDPHVERLRQSFAFLAARIHAKLEDDYPELSDAMLGVLYPHLTSPVPSMAVVEAELDLSQSIPTSGKPIGHKTKFISKSVGGGGPLQFRSAGETTLWPIRVKSLRVDHPTREEAGLGKGVNAVLRLTLESPGEHSFGALELDHLRLYLKGASRIAYELHEVLCTRLAGVRVRAGTHSFDLDPGKLQPVGFDASEAMLEYPHRSFAGYRLLQEYFAFPVRFLFLDLCGLARMRGWEEHELEITFALERELRVDTQDVDATNISLACIPLVNLFSKTADPIPVDARESEFPVHPDEKRPLDFEVYSISKVVGLSTRGEDELEYAPFYSLRHGHAAEGPDVYWHAHRRPSRRKGDRGTNAALSFVDLQMRRSAPVDRMLHVETLCTNRDLPSQVSNWRQDDDFSIENVTGVAIVRCVHVPTPSRRLAGRGAAHWRLISHLSLNYLSLVREGRDALREILRTYDFERSASTSDQIEGIEAVDSESALRWILAPNGSGYCRGTRTSLVLDRRHFLGASPYLFASVIERFLGLYCSINSFSELVLSTFDTSIEQQEVICQWPPRTGEQPVL